MPSPLRIAFLGCGFITRVHSRNLRRFRSEIVCGYALSESPYGLIWRHGTRPFGTLGSVRQHPELGHINEGRVVDAGRLVEAGEVGELQLRNPAVMRASSLRNFNSTAMPAELMNVTSPQSRRTRWWPPLTTSASARSRWSAQ